ncbi:MAG: radical SAM protein [Candidatus Omnitrophota bacterium]
MRPVPVPETYNYIGVFLTFGCNLNCSYCINHFEKGLQARPFLSGREWVTALNRLTSRPDLPVSLQGGEPSLHPDYLYIINHLKPELRIDLLTNLSFNIDQFMDQVDPRRLKRDSPYASIRVSYHPETMKLEETVEKVLRMLTKGYSIGIWSVLHPHWKEHVLKAQTACIARGIDFRTKEFLGEYEGKLYGEYKYPEACAKKSAGSVRCRTTELLIDPQAKVFRCHHDVYANTGPVGSLLDDGFQIDDTLRPCAAYGFCNPCDIKVKTNRFQQYGHTSVDIQFSDRTQPQGRP